jgi:hypothetical protein
MSRIELLEAFMNGRIGRRAFVRGLVGLGVSMAFAVACSDALSPRTTPGVGLKREGGDSDDDLYDDDLYDDDLYDDEKDDDEKDDDDKEKEKKKK